MNKCVACNTRFDGNDHHCSEEFETRSEAARNAEREDYLAYGTRLADGFALLEGL